MKKSTKIAIIVIALIVVIAVVIAVVMNLNKGAKKDDESTKPEGVSANQGESKETSNLRIANDEDLEDLIEEIYDGVDDLPALQTQVIDVADEDYVQAFTGLENGEDLEYLVVSEPLINARAYSLVIAKVQDGVNANKIAEEMNEKIDQRKWICVSAEKVYSTSSGDIVFLVMSDEETAKPVYDKFKELAGSVGKEYVKEAPEIELEPDMY